MAYNWRNPGQNDIPIQGRRYGGRGMRYPSGLRGCWQVSKISAFVGKRMIVSGVKEASVFMPILQTVSQLR